MLYILIIRIDGGIGYLPRLTVYCKAKLVTLQFGFVILHNLSLRYRELLRYIRTILHK